MRLSGVDPSVIRELSGIYKPFVKALKELISNAYDADATQIKVTISDDFRSIDITDDGAGMTPFNFYREFARLGGSSAWKNDGISAKGRRRIGFKGIGFLALARYCDALEIESRTDKSHADQLDVKCGNRKVIDVREELRHVVPDDLLVPHLTIGSVSLLSHGSKQRLIPSRDYVVSKGVIQLISRRTQTPGSHLSVGYSINCRPLLLQGRLDFNHLLSLEHQTDLHLLENFSDLSVTAVRGHPKSYTRVRVKNLKEFVVRELTAPRKRGKGWNITSGSGKEQFLWNLSRSTPIRDDFPPDTLPKPMQELQSRQNQTHLPALSLQWPGESVVELKRPLCLSKTTAQMEDACIPVHIKEGAVEAIGYVLASSEVLYPSECRGISVRVRNVQIGNPSFFGLERILAGARKAALSQISGEILVLKGLDTASAINPGRESFYEDNEQYIIFRRSLIGTEESIGGVLGQAIKTIMERSHLRSQLAHRIAAAKQRRKVLADISNAISYYSRQDKDIGFKINQFLEKPLRGNGLSEAREVVLRPVGRMAGFDVKETTGLQHEFHVDFHKRLVQFDFSNETWSNSVYLSGKYYEVSFKQGLPSGPICEFDNVKSRIYVNWDHPTKSSVNESGFLRSAIIWRLAHHVAAENADRMMDLALNLLAFQPD
jgi:hypothetical protein